MEILFIILALARTALSLTTVNLYSSDSFGGSWGICSDLNNSTYCSLTSTQWDNKINSVRITHGSCARLYDNSPPGGQLLVLGYPQFEDPDLDTSTFGNKLSSVEKCGRTTTTSRCPNGTFVKKFATSSDGNLLSQFSAQCFLPARNSHPSATLLSHPTVTGLGHPLKCFGAVRGLDYTYDTTREVYTKIEASCPAVGNQTCGDNEGACGFSTTIEEHTNLIKSVDIACCDVGNPAETCDPSDFFRPIMTCDALAAVASTTCGYSQTIGIGTTTTNSTSLTNELNFYGEIGVQLGGDLSIAGIGLNGNFHANLGFSATTTFNWNTASSETWSEETTHDVSMDVPPCVKTTLYQVEGICSFYSVKVNYFKRVDTTCSGTTTERMVSGEELEGRIITIRAGED